MHLNLDAPNVFETVLTVDNIRECAYDEVIENILDEAQGQVFQNANANAVAYVVIKVTR